MKTVNRSGLVVTVEVENLHGDDSHHVFTFSDEKIAEAAERVLRKHSLSTLFSTLKSDRIQYDHRKEMIHLHR